MTVHTGDILVTIDDRARLIAALLAATDYPQREWERHPHGTHMHARDTRRHLAGFAAHPAVVIAQHLLDDGVTLEALFGLALSYDPHTFTLGAQPAWLPSAFLGHLRDFRDTSGLHELWRGEPDWETGLEAIRAVLGGARIRQFLQPFLGDITETLVFMPNLCFPTDREVNVRVGSQLVVIAPPRVAWGESPPWEYRDDPAHIIRAAILGYTELLMTPYLARHADALVSVSQTPLPLGEQFLSRFPTWAGQFTGVFGLAAVAMYLEEHVSRREADAYALLERKTRGIDILPAAISVLRRFRAEQATGKYREIADLLPVFPMQLKVARRIKAL
jgi:hypothetical protein